MPVQKSQQKQSRLPAQKNNPKNHTIRTAARQNPVKIVMIKIVAESASTVLAVAALLHLR